MTYLDVITKLMVEYGQPRVEARLEAVRKEDTDIPGWVYNTSIEVPAAAEGRNA